MSKKNERVQKLIALDAMIRNQKRSKEGAAKFNRHQLDTALEVIEQVLRLDNIIHIKDDAKAG